MAQITINEISKNYTYSAGNISFCSVALPITASWGPAFEDPASLGSSLEEVLESTVFQHFPATQEGLEAFNSAFRGPAANYRSANDYSFQVAISLIANGYDVDVCRVCSGAHASGTLSATIGTGESATTGSVTLKAKYPGSFGNNLIGSLKKVTGRNYWNLITYIVDSTGGKNAVENLVFVFDLENSNDSIAHISEIESNFFTIVVDGIDTDDNVVFDADQVTLTGGSDRKADGTSDAMMAEAISLATTRFNLAPGTDSSQYVAALTAIKTAGVPTSKASAIRYMEWNYNAAMYVLDILADKLAYNTKRLIMPGWDDQNLLFLTGETVNRMSSLSPLHAKMMDIASSARCLTALLDIPRSLERSGVWVDSTDTNVEGYAQKVSRYLPSTGGTASDGLFSTHSALFGPWCQYKYAGTPRNVQAPPGFLALIMQISMIKNQTLQYEWIQPQTRRHSVVIGKPDYRVPKKLLDNWQSIEGVSLNVLTELPDTGMTVWGNSTAFEVPPATYNALQNLSTRYLFNAIKDVVYRAGIAITFQYNNEEAYSKFYCAVTPLLDTMLNVGAITKYTCTMSKDLDALDSVNLNSVIGQIQIWVEGIINDITIDLVALPAGTENQ